MIIQVVDSTIDHVWDLINTLREEDKEEIRAAGNTPNEAVLSSFNQSVIRRTLLINDEVAGMWGVYGNVLGTLGIPYFLTGEKINKLSPIKFARLYKQEVQKMKSIFPVLENCVDAKYKGAIRMLKIAGFELSEPVKINDNDFLRFKL